MDEAYVVRVGERVALVAPSRELAELALKYQIRRIGCLEYLGNITRGRFVQHLDYGQIYPANVVERMLMGVNRRLAGAFRRSIRAVNASFVDPVWFQYCIEVEKYPRWVYIRRRWVMEKCTWRYGVERFEVCTYEDTDGYVMAWCDWRGSLCSALVIPKGDIAGYIGRIPVNAFERILRDGVMPSCMDGDEVCRRFEEFALILRLME